MYLLQLLDSELDELREMRGDLPDTVKELQDKVHDMQTKVENCRAALKAGALERERKERETLEFLEKIEKYKSQQLEVTNNKEYDALTHQIDQAQSTIVVYEGEIELFANEAIEIKAKQEDYVAQLSVLSEELEIKQKELEEILAVTAEEERALVTKREEVLTQILTADFELYTRIRNAKGKAVAPIRRGSCSGCYNVVPPQLILEIKKNDQLYTCEHCGRILVSEELAQETSIT